MDQRLQSAHSKPQALHVSDRRGRCSTWPHHGPCWGLGRPRRSNRCAEDQDLGRCWRYGCESPRETRGRHEEATGPANKLESASDLRLRCITTKRFSYHANTTKDKWK